jgi:hypothetical protein
MEDDRIKEYNTQGGGVGTESVVENVKKRDSSRTLTYMGGCVREKTCRFVTMVYYYNYHNSGHYPSSYHLFITQPNCIGLSVPPRKHITSPLQAQQFNAIYRFLRMIY